MKIRNTLIFFIAFTINLFGNSQTLNLVDSTKVNQILDSAQLFISQDIPNSQKKIEEALKIAEKINYQKGAANAYYQMSLTYFNQGKFEQAEPFLIQSLTINKRIINYKGIANNLSSLGVINSYRGNYSYALTLYYQTLYIFEYLKDKKGLANTYNNIGIVFDSQNNLNEALNYYYRALKIREEIGLLRGVAQILNNIGIIYSRMEQYEKAASAFDRSIELAKTNHDDRTLSSAYGNRGKLYNLQGNYLLAKKYIQSALDISINNNDMKSIAYLTNNLAEVFFNDNNLNEAKKTYLRSLSLSERFGFSVMLNDNYLSLSKIYAAQKKFDSAYFYQIKHNSIKDSLFNESNTKQITELQEKFEVTKKNNQISLLTKDKELNEAIILRNQILIYVFIAVFVIVIALSLLLLNAYKQKEKALLHLEIFNKTLEERIAREVNQSREKDLMLTQQSRQAAMGEMIGNIAHQWRQPLNAVGIIIQNLQEAYDYGELDEKYIKDKVEKGMNIIQFMSQTIDDFRNFFKPDKEKQLFSINKVVIKAISFLDGSIKSNQINLVLNLNENVDIIGYPNEYAQVIINIINNARDALIERNISNPTIVITLVKANNSSQLRINDNAGGIDVKILDKVFDPYFTTKSVDKGTGLGLYMSKNIIERNMNGHLYAINESEGVSFIIEI